MFFKPFTEYLIWHIYLWVERPGFHSDLVYHIAGSACGQYEGKLVVWLVTRVGKMDPPCPLGINHFNHAQYKNCFRCRRIKRQKKVKTTKTYTTHKGYVSCYKHSCLSFPALEICNSWFLIKVFIFWLFTESFINQAGSVKTARYLPLPFCVFIDLDFVSVH